MRQFFGELILVGLAGALSKQPLSNTIMICSITFQELQIFIYLLFLYRPHKIVFWGADEFLISFPHHKKQKDKRFESLLSASGSLLPSSGRFASRSDWKRGS
jgi:hypothetical protein